MEAYEKQFGDVPKSTLMRCLMLVTYKTELASVINTYHLLHSIARYKNNTYLKVRISVRISISFSYFYRHQSLSALGKRLRDWTEKLFLLIVGVDRGGAILFLNLMLSMHLCSLKFRLSISISFP
jgi:hypothetical protein